MTRLTLAIAAAVAVSGCSNGRTRSTSTADDQANTARELRVAAPDTTAAADSINLSSRGTEPVSPVEQHVSSPRKGATTPKRSDHRRRAPSPASVDTSAPQGYASSPPADSVPETPAQPADTSTTSASADSASSAESNTATAPSDTASGQSDTVPAPSRDSSMAATPGAASDTTSRDTAAAAAETVAAVPETASAVPDTAPPKRDTAPAAPETATSGSPQPPPAESASDINRRTLPIGTEIHAALDDSISSRRDSAGRSVTAQVTENVTGSSGRILIPAGTTVRLTVTRLGSSKSKSSQGQDRKSVV